MEYHAMNYNIQEGYKGETIKLDDNHILDVPIGKFLTFAESNTSFCMYLDHKPTLEDINIFYKEVKKRIKGLKKLFYKLYRERAKNEKNLDSQMKKILKNKEN